jgi:hypothetical protein
VINTRAIGTRQKSRHLRRAATSRTSSALKGMARSPTATRYLKLVFSKYFNAYDPKKYVQILLVQHPSLNPVLSTNRFSKAYYNKRSCRALKKVRIRISPNNEGTLLL